MIDLKKILSICFISLICICNVGAKNEVIEIIRGNAKFNTVAAVLIIIFVVLGITLFVLDRRISKLEKEKEKKS